jgi:hypothetical protein
MPGVQATPRREPLIAVRQDAAPLVLSSHLDDAVWACFSLLLDARPPAVVATVFAGVPSPEPGWWDRMCGIADSAAHVRSRREEDAAVLAALGCRHVHLSFLDGQYRGADPLSAEPVVAELRECVPVASRVYAPAGIGDHPDHLIARDAGAVLAASGVPTTIYADYSYCTRHGWPRWIDPGGSENADEQWRRAIGHVVGDALSRPRLRRLSEPESAAKLRAMKGYVTQFAHVEAEEPRWQEDGLPPSDPRKRALEVFYDLDGAGAR